MDSRCTAALERLENLAGVPLVARLLDNLQNDGVFAAVAVSEIRKLGFGLLLDVDSPETRILPEAICCRMRSHSRDDVGDIAAFSAHATLRQQPRRRQRVHLRALEQSRDGHELVGTMRHRQQSGPVGQRRNAERRVVARLEHARA